MNKTKKPQKLTGGTNKARKKAQGKQYRTFNPHAKEGKDARDRRRVKEALARGLDLRKALLVATDGGKEAVRADAALRRVERALRNRALRVGWQSHLDQAILKHLVSEGYLRWEKREPFKHLKNAWKRKDQRFAPWVSYRLTKKGKALIGELLPKEKPNTEGEEPQNQPG